MRPSRSDNSGGPVDLGWLFLLPGIVLIAAAVLIAGEDALYDARFRRDEALAIEARHAERVERYAAYLEAVRRHDPTVVRSLVVGQLNAEPTDMVEERLAGLPVYDSTEVFASLEPPEATPAHRERVDSVLARWATDDSSRVWLLASGALCVFVGLLPPVSRRRGAGAAEDEVLAAADRLVEDDVDGEAGAEALEPGDEGDQREGDEPLGVVDEAAELDEDEVEDEVDGDDVDEEEPEEFEGDEGESDDEVSDGVESEAESEDNR